MCSETRHGATLGHWQKQLWFDFGLGVGHTNTFRNLSILLNSLWAPHLHLIAPPSGVRSYTVEHTDSDWMLFLIVSFACVACSSHRGSVWNWGAHQWAAGRSLGRVWKKKESAANQCLHRWLRGQGLPSSLGRTYHTFWRGPCWTKRKVSFIVTLFFNYKVLVLWIIKKVQLSPIKPFPALIWSCLKCWDLVLFSKMCF